MVVVDLLERRAADELRLRADPALAEHAERPVNLSRALLMLLLHDIVGIDAGDAPIPHRTIASGKAARAA